MAFGKLPEELEDNEAGISELWFERTRHYLWQKTKWLMGGGKGRGGSATPMPKPEELDGQGRWFLTG